MYWGKYVAHDNNRDGMGQFLALTQNITKTFLEWKPTILHDLHEASTYLYASTGTGPYNEQIDPDHHRRVVAAGEDRSHGDDQARRARRVDLRVLRRLGAELHVLHRALAQRDRPVLRGRRATGPICASRAVAARRAASGSGRTRRCRRSSGGRGTTRTSSSRRCSSRSITSPRTRTRTSRTTGSRTSARSSAARPVRPYALGDSRRPAAQAGCGRRGERAAASGPRGASRDVGVQGRQRQRRGRRLRHPRRPAVSHARRDVLLGAELRARQSESVRRHRLDVPATCATSSSRRSPTRACSTAHRRCSRPTPRRPAASRARARSSSSITRPTTC